MNGTWEAVATIIRVLFIASFLILIIGSFGYIGSMFMWELYPKKETFLWYAKIGGAAIVALFVIAWILGTFFAPTPVIDTELLFQQLSTIINMINIR